MIKKLMILIILSIMTVIFIAPSVQAATIFIEEPVADNGGLWHVEDGNRAYVFMRYTRSSVFYETGTIYTETTPGLDTSLHTLLINSVASDGLSFPNTNSLKTAEISNPNPELYNRFVIEIISSMNTESAGEILIETQYYDLVDEIVIDFHDVYTGIPGDLPYMTLSVDNEMVLSTRNLSESVSIDYGVEFNPYYLEVPFGVKIYWEKTEIADVITPDASEDSWEVLPYTSGSPVNPIDEWGTVTDINVVNQSISFNINYLGTIYPVSSFIVDGDLDFINKANDVLYYSDPNSGDRMLYFNFGETLDSAILAAQTFTNVSVWKGEALWNLTQNEIKVTDVLTVYNYIPEVDSDGNVYSYFYMPDVPIDNLISVSALLAYRYWDDGFLNIGDLEPGEIQYKSVSAVKGETSSVNPTWVEKTYTTAYIAGGLVAAGTISGVVAPIYGWPITAVCFVAAGVLTYSDVNEWFAYDINQIQKITPTISLTNEINNYIADINSDDQFTTDTDKLYKLHLATLNEYDDVQIMSELSNVTQVVWETDGEIFVLSEESIFNPDWGGPGTEIPSNTIGNDDMEILFYIASGVGAVIVFNKLKLDKKPGLLILIGGTVAYFLYNMGFI